jgi:hypothetical protein
MEPIQRDITPSEEWLQSLNATCNRLSTQYLNLLKSASSVAALNNLEEEGAAGSSNNAGGGRAATRATQHDPRGTLLNDAVYFTSF